MKKYIIKWQSKITGAKGQGTSSFTATIANKMVMQMNHECREVHHWKEAVKRSNK